ncbi:MAG TPA: helix-turn-helix transcriptional regulator [Candidatus Dormibacteraeota bacterium]|jgi:transcriptional regulator with XRE-family HTH domain|nr:helix-turn-helix transcriptional regulator [Candidatus Dormibacteraeota bacterium]
MSDEKAQAIGKRIRRLRKDRGWTQADLAAKTGLQTNTIARLERGKNRPADPSLEQLAKAFGVTASEILRY